MPERKRPWDSAGPLQRNTPPSGDGPKEAARCGLTEGLKGAPAEADAPAVFQTESLHAALSAGLCRGIPVHFGFLACSFGCRHLVSGDNRRGEGNGETQSSNHQNYLLHRFLLLVQKEARRREPVGLLAPGGADARRQARAGPKNTG